MDSNSQVSKYKTLEELDQTEGSTKKRKEESFLDDVQLALFKEVKIFNRREILIMVFRVYTFIFSFEILFNVTVIGRYKEFQVSLLNYRPLNMHRKSTEIL